MKVMRFLLGLVIGAGVALLVAPKSGRELREQLVGAAGDRMLGAPPEAYPGPDVAASWDVDSDRSGAATAVAEPSVAVEPAAEKPLVEPPAAEEAPEEAPVHEEPAIEPEPDEVVAVEPAVEPAEPLVAGPPVEEVPAEEPVAETPAAEEPTAEEPAVEQPAVEQPTAEEAAVAEAPPRPFPVWEQHPEEPAGEDLRARIEETRETLEAELAEPFAQEAAEQEVVDEVAPAEVVAEEVEVL
ncbi:MAG TPA: YtxH domain-containing protein, partial [Thermoleophilia bacterium]|nr:YtxH domain-containing protein [Thermoleophilia bacterium]